VAGGRSEVVCVAAAECKLQHLAKKGETKRSLD